MQDLSGARAIVDTCNSIDKLRRVYNWSAMKRSGFLTEPARTSDYLEAPGSDGYRGVHLILSYKGRKSAWDGLFIEVQLRTREQHAWATTVEILETVRKQRLRTAQGDASWKCFLGLMSSAIAIGEGQPTATPRPES